MLATGSYNICATYTSTHLLGLLKFVFLLKQHLRSWEQNLKDEHQNFHLRVKSRTSSGLILQPHFSRTLFYKNSYFNRVISS